MSYSKIDPIIKAWVVKQTLTLYEKHQDSEVRTVDVVNNSGKKFQIWIDRPVNNVVAVHAWDYKKQRQDWEVDSSKLGDVLDEAIQTVQSWGKDEK